MAKSFFEVFPQLKLDTDLQGMLDDATVSKVSTTRQRNSLRIYLGCGRLLPKEKVYFLENELKRQLFPHHTMNIKIIEKFQLSEQYTLKNLLDVYWNSILTEFHRYSLLEYNLLRHAKLDVVEEKVLRVSLEDTVLAHQKEEEIYHILEKIFNERCNLSIQIEMEFHEKEASKYRKNADIKMQNEVENVIRLSSFGAKRHPEGEYMESPEAGASEVPWETGDSAAKPAKKTAEKKTEKAAAVKKESSAAEKKPAKQEDRGGFKKSFGGKRDFRDRGSYKRSDNPDVVYGRDFDEEAIRIEQIMGEMGEVVIRGQILSMDERPIRGEKTILMFSITDFTDTIMVKMFCKNEYLDEIKNGGVAKGAFLKIKGVTTIDRFDSELTIGSVIGIKKIPSFVSTRMDTSPVKRVELHCHTKMSDMDGVSDVKDIIKRAMKWGHKAIAITDHGDVQAFPDANHAIGKDDDFKIIYGMEAYLVDDLKGLVEHPMGQSFADTFVVFDLETTGFSPSKNQIIEIGAVKVVNGSITERFSTFVNPKVPIPFEIEQLTSINDDMVLDAPTIDEILPKFMEFCQDAVMVAHNADFDMSFIKHNCSALGLECEKTVLDTVALSRVLLPALNRFKLDTVAKALNVSLAHHHRAVDDAACTAEIFVKLVEMLRDRGVETMEDLDQMESYTEETIRKMPSYHAIMLAQNDIGRVNLYRLVSDSHIKYYNRRPKIPKSEFMKYREGILLGSACEAGELYRTLLRGSSQEEVARIVQFYDYLEIQPLGNNAFMLRTDKEPVESEEDLKDINRQIVELGEQFNKLVVATCDVHFLDPEDEVYRRIIMAGKGFKDADNQAPLFLRTTDEMLEEFAYLGSAKAREVVIENPQKIARMVEKISPVNPNKCPPVIADSDQELRDICYRKAHEMYGEDLPVQVSSRLEKELNSIISNGYAVMYIIAQKLVWKSNADGYLVGSRGSVGSSFVATMSGITEVNPLSPHYYCEKCHYSDFESEEVRAFAGGCGYDMPDRNCPVCGEKLVKAGFDIPFETFLGFKGDKEPDIDLNFSGDYQAKAHKYTEVLFGEGHTFKAGTIGTLADKTAYGFVKNYYEERGQRKRGCEIERITEGCTGIRRSTGQHPGGIVVLPHGHSINEFTPVQHPANDMECGITTTHFDYHSIDHNLLKLDILGHDDPTMIRTLEDYITSDAMENEYNEEHPFVATEIPLDDKKVIELFHGTEILGIKPEDIDGCKLGCLGIPEFGTDFVIQMVQDTKPQTLSDLIRISGLSHGTNVWLGNAQELVKSGKATISTAICTRDDIMIYLINKGVESALAFTIMESVRKGKGLKPEWEEAMKAQDVPDWYIWSCKKISYMFPKAHAAAYVMMAYRIAYCKINYPLAYYGAYFGIRADAFSYAIMCQGKDKLNYYMKDYKKRSDTLTKKEQDVMKDMKIVQEMYARGFEFMPIDIYKAKATKFQIIDGKLMPSLASIEGMGDKAAEAVEEASKDGPYLSLDDFRQRTKVSKTVIDLMAELGLFGNLPQSNQLSLFDFS